MSNASIYFISASHLRDGLTFFACCVVAKKGILTIYLVKYFYDGAFSGATVFFLSVVVFCDLFAVSFSSLLKFHNDFDQSSLSDAE